MPSTSRTTRAAARASTHSKKFAKDPATFARIFATLQPKRLEIEDRTPESEFSDEQLEVYYAELKRQIAERAARASTPAALGSQRVN